MPLRPEHAISSEPWHSRQVLRGEDICYLGEARFQREYGWLQGAKVLQQEFPWSYPKKHFTKKLSRNQLQTFIPSYTNQLYSSTYKTGASPDLSSNLYFPSYFDTPFEMPLSNLLLHNFNTDFPGSLDHLPILSAFEDIKSLSCNVHQITQFDSAAIPSADIANVPYNQIGSEYSYTSISALDWNAPFRFRARGTQYVQNNEGCAASFLSGLYYAADGRFGYVNIPNDWQYLEYGSRFGGAELWVKGIIDFNARYTDTSLSTQWCSSRTTAYIRIAAGYVVGSQIYFDYDGQPQQFGEKWLNTLYRIGWIKAGRPDWAYRRTTYTGLEPNEEFMQQIDFVQCQWYVVGTMGSHTKWW